MGSIIGFTATCNLTEDRLKAALAVHQRVLSNFTHLQHRTFTLGNTRIDLWGHKDLSDCLHTLPDGSFLALIGSPHGAVSWATVEDSFSHAAEPDNFKLPWDDRVILLRISADGREWAMWNDWLGSIPVFQSQIHEGRIASTLEAVVVAAARFSCSDIFLPGLMSLLINGHIVGDWTLFKGMKTLPPDCSAKWDERGFHWEHLWTVMPTQDRWETGWDDLVDEMYQLSRQAIADVLKTQSSWILPLSGGLDSRLIAAVGAEIGATLHAYVWGPRESAEVVCSRQVARALDLPWKRVELGTHYLTQYTQQWADLFGSGIHFHGMYQMSFLDALESEPTGPVLSGFLGDLLSGAGLGLFGKDLLHPFPANGELYNEWYTHWPVKEVRSLMRVPVEDALKELAAEFQRQTDAVPGNQSCKLSFLLLWSRLRFFNSFQSTLCDYWRGTSAPYLNRAYARFCMSLPRAALDQRRLLGDVYRRHYGFMATIPGTYASEPFTRTGRYLLKRRIAKVLPAPLRRGPFGGFDEVPLRMDMDCLQATGLESLWPIHEVRDQLAQWIDISQVDAAYQAAMASKADIRPLRKLQSVQALAYRLLDNPGVDRESVDDSLSPVFQRI